MTLLRNRLRGDMEVPDGLIAIGELESSLKSEISGSTRLLPRSPLESVAIANSKDLAVWIQGKTSGTFNPAPELVIAASKPSHGIRPLQFWPLPERVLYRALADKLEPSLKAPAKNRGSYDDFLSLPLTAKSAKYVLTADVAACYQYIDHEILERELLAQTGSFAIVRSILLLLSEVTGKNYGLPQQSAPSDLLAEAYLDQVERRLLRRGIAVWRYNDDFRLAFSDWPSTVAGLEQLEEACRSLGLTLNESKTVPYKIINYMSSIARDHNARHTVASDAELDIPGITSEYEEDDGEELEDPNADAAIAVLREWERIAGSGTLLEEVSTEHYKAVLFTMSHAFRHLEAESSTDPDSIRISTSMLRYEQQLTPAIARFLSSRKGVGEKLVVDSLTDLLRNGAYFTQWQSLWLSSVFTDNAEFTVGATADDRISWAEKLIADPRSNEAVRAALVLMLAKHKQIAEDQILGIYDRTGPAARPYLAAALGFAGFQGRATLAAAGENLLQDLVYKWAFANA
ncbi:RNA-directed DNA polymerase [Saccharothrix saharensis]|uniref:RNA-directed DNA polymerase n=1 Tax=Saccharothrix saharensis TaxID=571190 RepID=UPI0036A5783A